MIKDLSGGSCFGMNYYPCEVVSVAEAAVTIFLFSQFGGTVAKPPEPPAKQRGANKTDSWHLTFSQSGSSTSNLQSKSLSYQLLLSSYCIPKIVLPSCLSTFYGFFKKPYCYRLKLISKHFKNMFSKTQKNIFPEDFIYCDFTASCFCLMIVLPFYLLASS